MLKVGNTTLENSPSTQFLGVIVDNSLSWKGHCDYLYSKLNVNRCLISRLKHLLPFSCLHNIYMWHHVEHPGVLGVPYHIHHINYICFRLFLRRRASDALHLKRIILFVNVTSFDDAVMSYMTSQHCTCIGHMTIYYKRATNTSVGGGFSQFISSLGSTLSPETLIWLVSNTCRSQCIKYISGWEPTSFNSNYCVLALVNSAASPAGTHKYLNKTWECHSTPC